MASIDLKFGIPDIEIGCASGAKINPSSFAGHDLIALFCPLDAAAARTELVAYQRYSAELVKRDAWLLTFAQHCEDFSVDGRTRVLTVPDKDGHAWVAFRNLTARPDEMDRSSGATFLFTRGGGLHRYWHGAGHVDDVLAELRSPTFEHLNQLDR